MKPSLVFPMKSHVLFLCLFRYIYFIWRKSLNPKSLLKLNLKSMLKNQGTNSFRVPCVNDDILVEILSRLHHKDMVRYKLVSKSWNQLITNVCVPLVNSTLAGFIVNSFDEGRPYAIKIEDGFLDLNEEKDLWFAGSSLPFTPFVDNLLHCSNGFFLLFEPQLASFHVYNPITKQYATIYHPKFRKSCILAGLVFDSSSDNSSYYIVWLNCTGTDIYVYVWSSVYHAWRQYIYRSFERNIVTVAWVPRFVFLGQSFYLLSFFGHLLKFGFKEKRVATIELPEIAKSKEPNIGTYGVSQGHLHYALSADDKKLMVWMLVENDPIYNWVIKYTLSIQDLGFRFGPDNSFSFYDFHPTSDILFLGHKYEVFSYHPDNKKMETVFKVLRSEYYQPCILPCILPFTRNLSALDAFELSSKDKMVQILGCSFFVLLSARFHGSRS